jgi:hypothetical protein
MLKFISIDQFYLVIIYVCFPFHLIFIESYFNLIFILIIYNILINLAFIISANRCFWKCYIKVATNIIKFFLYSIQQVQIKVILSLNILIILKMFIDAISFSMRSASTFIKFIAI